MLQAYFHPPGDSWEPYPSIILASVLGTTGDVMSFQMHAMKYASLLTAGTLLWIGAAGAAPRTSPGDAGVSPASVMRGQAEATETDPDLAPELQRQVVVYPTRAAA